MENRALNIREENYPIIARVAELAIAEKRSISNMGAVLLEEAVAARDTKAEKSPSLEGGVD
jgi:hypothetical protein